MDALFFGHGRIIDHLLDDKRCWLAVKNVEATYDINVGTDHRCVRQDLQIETGSPQKTPRRDVAKRSLRGWTPAGADNYRESVDAALKAAILDDGSFLQSLERSGSRSRQCSL